MKFELRSTNRSVLLSFLVLWLLFSTAQSTAAAANSTSASANSTKAGGSAANKTGDADSYPRSCYQELLTSYGFEGLAEPNNGERVLPFCPSVRMSCCSLRDQQQIFLRWNKGQEEKNISEHFESNIRIYQRLVDSLGDVQVYAKSVRDTVTKNVSNCKLLASRILTYEIDEVKQQIFQNLIQSKEFFVKTYRGFYCTLCNYENHRFFDPTLKTVTFSQSFCRDMVKNNLSTLLLLHIDLGRLMNVVSKFLTTCNSSGDYNTDAVTDASLIIDENRNVTKMLSACRRNRNTVDWFNKCQGICNNFSMVEFSPFFEPNLDKVSAYIRFIRDKLSNVGVQSAVKIIAVGEFITPTAGEKPVSAVAPKTTNAAAATPTASADKPATGASNNAGEIYKSALLPTLSLKRGSFKHMFSAFGGISSHEEGKNTMITENAYLEIATALELRSSDSSIDFGTGFESSSDSLTAFSQPGFKKQAFDAILAAAAKRQADLEIAIMRAAMANSTNSTNSSALHHAKKHTARRRKLRGNNRKLKFGAILRTLTASVLLAIVGLIL